MAMLAPAGPATHANEPGIVPRRGVFFFHISRPGYPEPQKSAPCWLRPQDPLRSLRLPDHQAAVMCEPLRTLQPLASSLASGLVAHATGPLQALEESAPIRGLAEEEGRWDVQRIR